jgi:hypothetical protein
LQHDIIRPIFHRLSDDQTDIRKNNKMKKSCFVFLVILVIVIFSGCSIREDKNNAESIASSYFEAIKNVDFNMALTFYSSNFFEKTPRENALENLQLMTNKFGKLISYELKAWRVNNIVKGGGNIEAGTFVSLTYEITHTNYLVTEELHLFRPSSSKEMKIQGYGIISSSKREKID